MEQSLKRLKTDYIDLYQIHWPDRPVPLFGAQPNIHHFRDGPMVPFDEQLRAMENVITAGKVRHIGLSNETPWGVMRFVMHAEMDGLPRVQTIQNAYNLLNRTYEMGLSEIDIRENVGLLSYSPLGQGYLTGKYQKGALPDGSRKALFNRLQRYEGPGVEEAIDKYEAVARKFGTTVTALALKFCDTRPFMTSTIIGATSMEQLIEDVEGFDLAWSEEIEEAVNQVHLSNPNPCN